MAQTQFELRRKLLQLEALYDVGRALNTLRPEGELLEELMQRAIAVLDAMTGFVFTLDDKLNVQQVFSFGLEAPPLTDGAVKQAMTTRTAIAAGDQLIAPMIGGDVIVGMLGVGGKEERGAARRGSWGEDDLRFLESLASIGAPASSRWPRAARSSSTKWATSP